MSKRDLRKAQRQQQVDTCCESIVDLSPLDVGSIEHPVILPGRTILDRMYPQTPGFWKTNAKAFAHLKDILDAVRTQLLEDYQIRIVNVTGRSWAYDDFTLLNPNWKEGDDPIEKTAVWHGRLVRMYQQEIDSGGVSGVYELGALQFPWHSKGGQATKCLNGRERDESKRQYFSFDVTELEHEETLCKAMLPNCGNRAAGLAVHYPGVETALLEERLARRAKRAKAFKASTVKVINEHIKTGHLPAGNRASLELGEVKSERVALPEAGGTRAT